MRNYNIYQQYTIDDGKIIAINPEYAVEEFTNAMKASHFFRKQQPALVGEEMKRMKSAAQLLKQTQPSSAIGGTQLTDNQKMSAPFTTSGVVTPKQKKQGAFNFKKFKNLSAF